MKPCFAGLGFLTLAAAPLAAIPLALPTEAAQAHANQQPAIERHYADASDTTRFERQLFHSDR